MRTQVGIVGAGPAGLMLSHLLHLRGVESVVVDIQTRDTIEQTIKAGILEQGTVDLMRQTGVGDRMMRDGFVHHGINLAFEGGIHRINLTELSGGRSVMVYAQHEVLKDLIAKRARRRRRRPVRGVRHRRRRHRDRAADDHASPTRAGQETLECDFVIGADGSRTMCRYLIPERQGLFPAVPVRLVRDPRRSAALVGRADLRALRARVRAGVDPLSVGAAAVLPVRPRDQRRRLVRRPHLVGVLRAARPLRGDGQGGHIFKKDVLQFRSFVCEPMQYGRLFLAGDAAHTVPPTGAKGLNLAMADVHVLDRALGAYYRPRTPGCSSPTPRTALRRVWRAQWFSFWMTSMLHRFSDASDFDLRRQVAELELVTSSPTAAKTLADNYTGLPLV